ncbi:MAG: hypothetical protein KAU21_20110 [Gammaproteobacteria bacterium]|nr:hypothetical protein [Gammaproteobacteria bacterium]
MKKIIISLLCLFAVACQSGNNKNSGTPGWIQNPKDGAVGSCPTHVMGRHHQEELAIARARTRLAARYGVTVDQIRDIKEHVNNDSYSVTADTVSKLVIKNKEVKAHVRNVWYDRQRDVIWAWVYPVN